MPVSDQRDARIGRAALWFAAACIVALAATVMALAVPGLSDELRGDRPPLAYTVGDRMDLDPARFSSSARTLFLFSRFSCGACQTSKPIMAALVAGVAKRPDVQVVLVVPDEVPDEERLFARELGLDSSHILQTDLRRLRLRQVPSMVLTDDSGRILIAREGLLTETDRDDVLGLVRLPLTRP